MTRESITLVPLFIWSLLTIRPPKTSPYGQSVDMWSLGAVLFHILCGEPPYMGRGDDKGSQMLRNIMTTDPDFGLLRKAGVSEEGIDFVGRLLNRDPSSRPDEQACFTHEWIANMADVDEYERDDDFLFPIGETGLSDIGEDLEDELDASQLSLYDKDGQGLGQVNELEDDAQVKRRRFDYPSLIPYPSLPNLASFNPVESIPESSRGRLFGEITASVRRSSGVFQASLGEFGEDGFSVHDFVSSSGESINDRNSVYSVVSLPQIPFGGSAPSLMGAENLVGQLNMNSSPKMDDPVLEEPIRLLSSEHMKGIGTSDDSDDDRLRVSLNEDTPKPDRFHRRTPLAVPETASECSSDDNFDIEGPELSDNELAVTIDAVTGRETTGAPETETGEKDYNGNDDDYNISADNLPSSHAAQIPPTPESVTGTPLNKARPLLGKLTTIPGSIFDLTLELENRMTSWGRGPQASICYPDRMDTRIPAYALEVTFWAPAIEARIAAGEDWKTVPDVMTILSTKARRCIWVNGVELHRGPQDGQGKLGFQYGKLYTNDIITVYEHKDKFLKFQCEFYHGDSARTRPENERGFIVRKVLMSKEDVNAKRLPIQRGSSESHK